VDTLPYPVKHVVIVSSGYTLRNGLSGLPYPGERGLEPGPGSRAAGVRVHAACAGLYI